MSNISIQFSSEHNGFLIEAPDSFEGRLVFSVPEFHGKIGEDRFAIKQTLIEDPDVNEPEGNYFTLDIPPYQAGIDFKGAIIAETDNDIHWGIQLTNVLEDPIDSAHHTFSLNFNDAPDLADPEGERTYLYTETGWDSLKALSNEPGIKINRVHNPFNIGAAYNYTTVMWRMITRHDIHKSSIVALAIEKGYTFASDHNCWSNCMVGGSRWATIRPQVKQEIKGRIYLMNSLDDLRSIYSRDFGTGGSRSDG